MGLISTIYFEQTVHINMTMYVECRMHAHQPLFNGSIPNECRLQSDDIGNTFLL